MLTLASGRIGANLSEEISLVGVTRMGTHISHRNPWRTSAHFAIEAEAHSEMFNSAQTSREPWDYKKGKPSKRAQKSRNQDFTRAKERYENQHER